MLRRIAFAAVFAAAILVQALPAQSDTALIVGTVTDASGAAVPNAPIQIRDDRTAATVTVLSGAEGNYASPPLRPGSHTLTITVPGFRTIIQTMRLEVDQRALLDFSLQPGGLNESVTVEASVQLLDTQSAALGNVRTTQAINDLPLNGRNFVTLFHLASGVSTNGGGNTLNPSISNQTGVQGGAVNGARVSNNNYQYDGVQSNDNEQGVLVFAPMPDAIQEFKVQTSGMDASFGRNGGGTINLVMKSGANEFHGSAFEFLRNSKVDARNYFDSQTAAKPPFKQNQFGGTLGGRVIRDRTFFFVDYQGTRNRQAQTLRSTVPTALMKQGNFSELGVTLYDPSTTTGQNGTLTRTVFPGAIVPATRFNSAGAKLLALYPDANLPGLANNYLRNPNRRADPDQADVRINHRATDRDAVFGRYSYFKQPAFNPGYLPGPAIGAGPGFPGDYVTKGQQFVLGYTRTFTPSLIYELRAGYSRLKILAVSENQGTNLASETGIPGIDEYGYNQSGLGQISVTGFASLGQANFIPATKVTNNYEYSNRFSYIRGKHSMKWGYDLLFRGLNAYAPTAGMGSFTFTGQFTQNPTSAARTGSALADTLLGLDATARLSFWQTFGVRRREHGLYFNDDYRVTTKLTVNLGMRWDAATPWGEVHNRMANFVPGLGDVFPLNSTQFPHGAMQAINYRDFSPRVGVSYQVTPRTVMRAGFGIFYTFPPTGTVNMGIANAPFSGELNIANNVQATNLNTVTPISSGFPHVAAGNFPSAGTNFVYWPYHDPDTYLMQRNFSVQRLLAKEMALTLAYVGSRGIHLQIYPDINQPVPGPGAAAGRRAYPNLGTATGMQRMADSYFNSFQTVVEKRFSAGYSLQAVYTWSHAVDTGSTDVQGGSPQNVNNLRGDRGASDYDGRHRAIVSFSYELPFGRGKAIGGAMHGATQAVLGSWQVNGIGSLYTGAPFSPSTGANTLGSGAATQRPDRIGDGNLPSDQRTVQRWFDPAAFTTPALYAFGNAGRNILHGPGTKQLDFSLFKKFPLAGETRRVEFRAEAFNLMNTPQFNNPSATIGTSTAGVISSAGQPTFFQRTSRQIQLALKFYF